LLCSGPIDETMVGLDPFMIDTEREIQWRITGAAIWWIYHEQMNKTRLEAFSDGVFAIVITIMVLELKIPHGTDWAALKPLLPVFLSYVLSFIFLGI
jgi:Endosomal/lysosomal potassium channel TMEM175